MERGDASFTFLHRVEEVEWNIADQRWQSALALALTLPDICGGVAFPEIVRRYRDGRIMRDRQNNPTRDVGGQYIRWFDEYADPFFRISPDAERAYICGERCWQLRCEYLHQNKGFANEEDEEAVRFHLGVNCGTSVCQLVQPQMSDGRDIRIDIEQFCLRMCRAARSYYDAVHGEKDFSLYNTPVLDFIQATQEEPRQGTVAVLARDEIYLAGLLAAMRDVSNQVRGFTAPEAARAAFSKEKPMLWIVSEELLRQKDQPWRADRTTPVILLARVSESASEIVKDPGKLSVLPIPLDLTALRRAVRDFL